MFPDPLAPDPPGTNTQYYKKVIRFDVCSYCGEKGPSTLDHITPKSKGGNGSWRNLTSACNECNGLKGDLSLLDFLIRRSNGDIYKKDKKVGEEINILIGTMRAVDCWKTREEIRTSVKAIFGVDMRPSRSAVAKYVIFMYRKGILVRRKRKKKNSFTFEYKLSEAWRIYGK